MADSSNTRTGQEYYEKALTIRKFFEKIDKDKREARKLELLKTKQLENDIDKLVEKTKRIKVKKHLENMPDYVPINNKIKAIII